MQYTTEMVKGYRDENGHEDTELLAGLPLLGFRSLREGTVDFGRNEEEENAVAANEDEARQEEGCEDVDRLADVACAVHEAGQTILLRGRDDEDS